METAHPSFVEADGKGGTPRDEITSLAPSVALLDLGVKPALCA